MTLDDRIHIRIPTLLKRAAKVKAAKEDTTLTRVIIAALIKWTGYKPDQDPPTLP